MVYKHNKKVKQMNWFLYTESFRNNEGLKVILLLFLNYFKKEPHFQHKFFEFFICL